MPMRQLGSYFHVAMNGMAASDKIFKLLDTETGCDGTRDLTDKFDIAIGNVSYAYDHNPVLQDISMEIPQNSFVAIVGESGSGKSTLAKILCGINSGYSGKITIDHIDLSDIKMSSLQKNILYLSSNAYLFKGTVRDNLRYAKLQASDEELWDVLRQAKLEEFIKNEGGLEMIINEGSTNISGGQRQRLAFARALLYDPQVYIFDEATSNIDMESEENIIQLIHELVKTKTVIMISHRLANVTAADKIYVLDKGYLTETGTHQELLDKSGTYKRLWEYQYSLENFGGAVHE